MQIDTPILHARRICLTNAARATQKDMLMMPDACHAICTLSSLDAALTIQVAKTTHSTPQVLTFPAK
jgi:hypothetical protein